MTFDPTAGHLPEPGAVLLPTQARFVTDPEQFLVMEKGRRTGGSWGTAYGAAEHGSASREAGGMNVYYIPQTFEDAVEFIETCGRWLRALGVATDAMDAGTWGAVVDEDEGGQAIWAEQDPDRAIKTYSIRVPASGFRIVALSSSPARIRGKQGLIIFDEAAFHKDFRAVLKSAMAMVLRGGKIWVISTHNGDTSAFAEEIEKIRNGERRGKVYSYPFRTAVAEGMYRRICEMQGDEWTQEKEDAWITAAYEYYGDDAAEELDAIPASGEGSYLPAVLIDRAMVAAPILRWSFPDEFGLLPEPDRRAQVQTRINDELAPLLSALLPSAEHVYGLDYARVGDLTVIAPARVEATMRRVVPFGVELRNCPARQQEQILWYLIRGLPRFRAGRQDATGNGATLAEYTVDEIGAAVEGVTLNDPVYVTGMSGLKESLEDGLLLIPRDQDWRRDLRQVAKVRGIPKIGGEHREGLDGGKRHGDAAVALMLMDMAARAEPVAMDYQSTGPDAVMLTIDYYGESGLIGTDTGWGTLRGNNDLRGWD